MRPGCDHRREHDENATSSNSRRMRKDDQVKARYRRRSTMRRRNARSPGFVTGVFDEVPQTTVPPFIQFGSPTKTRGIYVRPAGWKVRSDLRLVGVPEQESLTILDAIVSGTGRASRRSRRNPRPLPARLVGLAAPIGRVRSDGRGTLYGCGSRRRRTRGRIRPRWGEYGKRTTTGRCRDDEASQDTVRWFRYASSAGTRSQRCRVVAGRERRHPEVTGVRRRLEGQIAGLKDWSGFVLRPARRSG